MFAEELKIVKRPGVRANCRFNDDNINKCCSLTLCRINKPSVNYKINNIELRIDSESKGLSVHRDNKLSVTQKGYKNIGSINQHCKE